MTESLSRFAGQLADTARAAIMPHFRADKLALCAKDDNSPVTIADRAAEKAMREMINKEYPAHGIIGEEYQDENPAAGFVWVLDPIDGTRSFITGSRLFCTLIALLQEGEPVIGVICMTALGERWTGVCQKGKKGYALFNGKQCRTASCQSLAAATMITTTFGCGSVRQNEGMQKLSAKAAYLRLGGDGEGYGSVAAGFADIAADVQMHRHDYLALVPIVRGAGGSISDWRGEENLNINSGKTDIIAAATPKLHEQALAAL
ncbi:MAG: inositol monophosphatase family protein [Gammaproteobacteria bacterium]